MKRPLLIGIALGATAFGSLADEPGPQVIASSLVEQAALFESLAGKTDFAEKAVDADGNILFVCFNHHDFFKKRNPEAPGLTDEDLKKLLHFPKLEGLTLQRQPMSDTGLAVLAAFPDMKVLRLIHGMPCRFLGKMVSPTLRRRPI